MITKKLCVETLTELLAKQKPNKDNQQFIDVLNAVLNEIGVCSTCNGTGSRYTQKQEGNGYRVMCDIRGKKWFLYPCNACAGKKQIIETECKSCGTLADIVCGQRHVEYCPACENRLIRTGLLR